MTARPATLPDWDAGAIRYPWSKRLGLSAVLSAPLLVAVASALGAGWEGGAIAVALIWIAFCLFVVWRADTSAPLRTLSPRPLDHDRFQNLAAGMAERIGMPTPRLYEIDGAGPNALVFGTRRPALAVTRELLEGFTRTEQEAVVAHSLLRIHSGHLWLMHVAAAFGRLGSRFAPRVGETDDVHAAALTRYPPALVAAIEKAEPVEGATAPFWFVAHGPSHRDQRERMAALADL